MTGGTKIAVSAIEAAYLQYTDAQRIKRNNVDVFEASHIVDNDFY
jgi:hypothetical protein